VDRLSGLAKAIDEYDAVSAAECAKGIIAEGIDPLAAFDAMTQTIKTIGDDFEAGTRWLPDLIGAADAMKAATPILEEALKAEGGKRQSLGRVVAGTVHGDIHSIGIEMVCTLLVAAGFDVQYLGIDVDAERFVEAVREGEAGILALSALLTVTSAEDRRVIQMLVDAGLRDKVKVMVGGGAINADFAAKIGADGYEPSAPGAVELAKSFVGAV
jgi:methanogenic corrinoid protein MtbC1